MKKPTFLHGVLVSKIFSDWAIYPTEIIKILFERGLDITSKKLANDNKNYSDREIKVLRKTKNISRDWNDEQMYQFFSALELI